LHRIERVTHTEALRRPGHQLHQTLRARPRDRLGIVARLTEITACSSCGDIFVSCATLWIIGFRLSSLSSRSVAGTARAGRRESNRGNQDRRRRRRDHHVRVSLVWKFDRHDRPLPVVPA